MLLKQRVEVVGLQAKPQYNGPFGRIAAVQAQLASLDRTTHIVFFGATSGESENKNNNGTGAGGSKHDGGRSSSSSSNGNNNGSEAAEVGANGDDDDDDDDDGDGAAAEEEEEEGAGDDIVALEYAHLFIRRGFQHVSILRGGFAALVKELQDMHTLQQQAIAAAAESSSSSPSAPSTLSSSSTTTSTLQPDSLTGVWPLPDNCRVLSAAVVARRHAEAEARSAAASEDLARQRQRQDDDAQQPPVVLVEERHGQRGVVGEAHLGELGELRRVALRRVRGELVREAPPYKIAE